MKVFYTLPYVSYFSSWEQLADILITADSEALARTSQDMQYHRFNLERESSRMWTRVFGKLASDMKAETGLPSASTMLEWLEINPSATMEDIHLASKNSSWHVPSSPPFFCRSIF